jgi:hypothetical protein
MMDAKEHEADFIDGKELKGKLERGEVFKLVMVLGEWEYRAKRIPPDRYASAPPRKGFRRSTPTTRLSSTTLARPAPQVG